VEDSDGRLVVLLPPSLTSVVNSVRVKISRGDSELDNGRYGGIGNGGRLHSRLLRKIENRDLAEVHHTLARHSQTSYLYPSASRSHYENP